MKIIGKILLWLAAAVLLIVLLGGAAIGIKYYQVRRSNAQVELTAPPERSEPVVLGEKITLRATFRLPWGMRPVSLNAEPASGSQLTGLPGFQRVRRGWGSDWWQGNIPLQCYREGELKSGTAQAVFSNRQSIDLTLPPLRVKAPAVQGDQLEIAGELETARPRRTAGMLYWLLPAILLAAAALLLWRVLRRKRVRRQMPWERALKAIRDLLDTVRTGALSPELSVIRLTDIVREYMEQRFQLRAGRQTTAEFMADLERGKGDLQPRHREFLRDFLNAADLVKFARMPADSGLFEHAADKAGELIRETTPSETGKEKNP